MNHISDFTKPEEQIIYDLINGDNNSNFTPAEFTLGTARPVDGKVKMTLTATPGSGYGNTAEVEYTRVKIQDFFDLYFKEGLTLQQGDSLTMADLLPEINAGLGTAITAESIVDIAVGDWEGIPHEVKELTFTISPSSKVYEGSVKLSLDGNDIPLSQAVTAKILSGLHLPGYVDSVNYQPMIDAMLYPFEANTTQTEEEILLELHRYFGLPSGDLSFAPGTVFPSFSYPERKVTLRSNNPLVSFNNSPETQIELGLSRYVIPNADFPGMLSNGAQWTWDATRGWYNDVNQPDTGLGSLVPIPALNRFAKRLRRLGANFSQNPTSNGNGLGSNYLSTLQGDVRLRAGTWDQFSPGTDQWIYHDNKEYRAGGAVVNQVYFVTFPAPSQRAEITSFEVSSAWRNGYVKGPRGMKDIFVEMFVTRAPVRAKQFRILIDDVQSDVYAEMEDLLFLDKDGVNQLTSANLKSFDDSSRYPSKTSGAYSPLMLVVGEGASNSKWTSAGNQQNGSWVSFELNEEVTLESLQIKASTLPGRAPKNFRFQVREGGSQWRTIKRFGPEATWTAQVTRTYVF